METTDNIEQVHNLQIQLNTLARSDVIINNIKTEQAEILSNPETSIHKKRINIVELLEVIPLRLDINVTCKYYEHTNNKTEKVYKYM